MEQVNDAAQRLRSQISSLESVLDDLKEQLTEAERASKQESASINGTSYKTVEHDSIPSTYSKGPYSALIPEEYQRYGRQMIMPEVGLHGQLGLKSSSILVVGVGGLGCPAAAYLVGAGVGRIGLVDGDTVEVSNLHRQVLHTSNRVGLPKVESAIRYLKELNHHVHLEPHPYSLTPSTAIDLFERYNVILDCTDYPTSRYLISDAAVIAQRPLISASALKTEGQLMVLNNPPRKHNEPGGFCYRCVFPKPPPAESVMTCGEGGILGPVVGTMGVLMAMEALKILLSQTHLGENESSTTSVTPPPTLLLYSAYSNPVFRTVRLGGKRKDCASCSEAPSISSSALKSGEMDYNTFCGTISLSQTLNANERVSAKEYQDIRNSARRPHILVDVREKVQFNICHLQNSVNLPFSEISSDPDKTLGVLSENVDPAALLCFICRFGNDSQVAVQKFKDVSHTNPVKYSAVKDVRGGLRSWRRDVDTEFPEY